MKKDPYEKLLSRKRKWTPVKPTAGVLKSGAEETIRRALAIRHMELPVGEFIKEGLEKDVPENARTLLIDNVKDEERHDLALGYIINVHKADAAAPLKILPESEQMPDGISKLINFLGCRISLSFLHCSSV